MAKTRGTAVLRANVQGYRRVEGKLRGAGRIIQPAINAEFRGRLSGRMLNIARDYAPEETGRLSEHLVVPVSTRAGRVFATLRSPVRDEGSNYPYTGVTRFGHRKAYIYPVRRPVLRFFWHRYSRWHTAKRVRGRRVAFDWVERARPRIERETAQSAQRIGRVIGTRIVSG